MSDLDLGTIPAEANMDQKYALLNKEGKQQCPQCKQPLPFEAFHASRRGQNGSLCIACKKKYNRTRYVANRGLTQGRHRERVYGITTEQFQTMLDEQHNACGVCGVDFAVLPTSQMH